MSFQYIVAIICGLGAVIVTIFHIGTPEKTEQDEADTSDSEENSERSTAAQLSVNMNWSDWFREKHFFFVRFMTI